MILVFKVWGVWSLKKIIYQLEKMEYYYYFTFNNCRVPRTLAGSSCSFFREDKYLDLEADMVSSGVFLTIIPYIFSKADLNFWKFFFSHFVCPRCPRDLLVSQKQYIEKDCVVYPDTLTSFNPSKLTSFLTSQWVTNSSKTLPSFIQESNDVHFIQFYS